MITRLYLGGDNEKGGQRFPLERVARVVSNQTDGATLIPAHGLYKGKLEETWVIEFWDVPLDEVNSIAAVLKFVFNQESIGLTVNGEVSLV